MIIVGRFILFVIIGLVINTALYIDFTTDMFVIMECIDMSIFHNTILITIKFDDIFKRLFIQTSR